MVGGMTPPAQGTWKALDPHCPTCQVISDGSISPTGASQFYAGSGAPTIAGTAGDFFFRTDTPATSLQRIYVCTVTGTAGAATWVGIA